MIAINKAEKDAIIKRFPKTHIVRTMKRKSKRHRYYCEESRQVMRFLNKIRNVSISSESNGEDGRKYK